MLYDLIIIGAGPAGITASIYAARKGMKFLVLTKDVGGQAILSMDIENYTGYQFITGVELVQKFKRHLEQFSVQLKEGMEVEKVEKKDDIINVSAGEEQYSAKSVIIATGRVPRKLGIVGEEEFRGRGVTYCATCDAPLFRGKVVAVVGGGNSALDAVLQLVKIAQKVYLIDIAEALKADRIMIEKALGSGKVEVFTHTLIKGIFGDGLVKEISIVKGGKEERLTVQGVFIEIGSHPASTVCEELEKNDSEEIVVNCKCETNVPGIFACGDVTNVYAKQIIVACGEGAKAALASFEYVSRFR